MRRKTGALAGLVAALLVLTACAGQDEAETSSSASATPSQAPEPDPPPQAGQCHRISLDAAARPTVGGDTAVDCSERHTSVTVAVRPLDLVDDGHLLAVDSPAAQRRLAQTCPRSLLERTGGDPTTRRLSRLQVVWFTPSDEQVQAGADWVRCDVVAVGSEDRLIPLPARLRGMLDREGALDTFGTCGTASPAADDFRRVACGQRHSWRAIDVVDLPTDARFLDEAVTDQADSTCQDLVSTASGGSLELTWAFEWPTLPQWRSGQRYGWCWTPT